MKKKMFSFENFEIINVLVKDRASAKRMNESALVEKIIFDAFLPTDSTSRNIIESRLYAGPQSITKVLDALYANNAAGTDFCAVHDNFFPLVNISKEIEIDHPTFISGEEGELYHIKSQIKSLIEKFEHLGKDDYRYLCEKEELKSLLSMLDKSPKTFKPLSLYIFIISNWEVLKNSTFTFRLLSGLSFLAPDFESTPSERCDLIDTIAKVSNEWL